ncbi:Uncharacterised protein [uncultured archaeon]|nr:Uncharacterised protein [uncultured archaeon]
MSTLPVMTTVQLLLFANKAATSWRSISTAAASTPLVWTFSPAILAISEALPLMMSTFTLSKISKHASSRSLVAPAPQTSRTTGIPFRFAAMAASFIASTKSGVSVPMLRTRAEAMLAMSATSSLACAMTGEAPKTLTMLAQS